MTALGAGVGQPEGHSPARGPSQPRVDNRQRTSARRVAELREDLGGRELAIVRQVAELKLMSSRQIEAVHFDAREHRSQTAAARACRRVLTQLTNERLLIRLERRIGGVRAGSAAFVYAIGPVGQRVLELPGSRRRFREPSIGFLQHTLAIAQVVVDLTVAARQPTTTATEAGLEIMTIETEPRCWRKVPDVGGVTTLRPDLFVSLGVGDYEHRWFIEVDLGTEHLPTLIRKCQAYEQYYRSGIEQNQHNVFPRVLWTMNSNQRRQRLGEAIEDNRGLTDELFVATTTEQALTVMAGGQP